MYAISASPEADNASVNVTSAKGGGPVLSEHCKNSFLARRDGNARYIPAISTNPIVARNDNCERFTRNRHDPLRRMSDRGHVADCHGFPYYRSDRTNGSRDAVLVKDVGVSCSLLKESTVGPGVLSITGFESYLVRQLKLEYNELSNIMRKINAYTKDILSSLASRRRREDHALERSYAASRRHAASQYADEMEDPCLKLRFRNDARKKRRRSEIDVSNNFSEEDIIRKRTYEKRTSTRRPRAGLDKAFSKRILEFSPKCSGMLLRNYLIMKREKVPSSSPKTFLRKAETSVSPSRLCRYRGTDKSRKSFYTNKCDPLVLTNWREVSRRKAVRGSKNAFPASTSGESRCTVSCI